MSPPSFKSHLPAIFASACGTIGAAIGTSYLGSFGTFIGLAAGSVITGTVAFNVERIIRRSGDLAKAKAKAVRQRGGRPLTPHETQIITAIVDSRHRHQRAFRWQPVALVAGCALALSVAVFTGWTLAAGRPVADVVRHHTPPPTPAPTLAPTQAPASSTAAPVVTPTFSPVPSVSTVTVTPTPTPTLTPTDTPTPTVTPAPSSSLSP